MWAQFAGFSYNDLYLILIFFALQIRGVLNCYCVYYYSIMVLKHAKDANIPVNNT